MAFILAMLNVIIKEERYDHDFVTTYCVGFDELINRVILPESTYVERLDPVGDLAGIWPVAVFRQPVIQPLHDTKPLFDIAKGLAGRLDLSDYFDYTIKAVASSQSPVCSF
jgi:thiosulfate reductase/polysulfide reductase chain A